MSVTNGFIVHLSLAPVAVNCELSKIKRSADRIESNKIYARPIGGNAAAALAGLYLIEFTLGKSGRKRNWTAKTIVPCDLHKNTHFNFANRIKHAFVRICSMYVWLTMIFVLLQVCFRSFCKQTNAKLFPAVSFSYFTNLKVICTVARDDNTD